MKNFIMISRNVSSAHITAGERDFNMVSLLQSRTIAFGKRKFLSGISNSRFDAFHEPERYFEHEAHCFLSLEISFVLRDD